MARLAEYMHELAQMLGEVHAVHFVRLEGGSTVIIHNVEAESVPKVAARAVAVARRQAPSGAMRAYETINRMLRADNGKAIYRETSGAEIIRFPGIEDAVRYDSVTQQCAVDGEVIRIGGTGRNVPVMLRSENDLIGNCYTNRTTAKELATHLFEPVRLLGTGRFIRETHGGWKLDYFAISSFSPLSNEPLSSVIRALRAIPGGEWGEDALEHLQMLRHEGESNGGV
jgi:hypothetical protein